MRSIQTGVAVPLDAVKPLDGLLRYRARCIELVRQAGRSGAARRDRSPVTGRPLESCGGIEGLPYGRCPDTGGYFLMEAPSAEAWAQVLASANQARHAPSGFHAEIARSRSANVYLPKVEWIHDTLRLQEMPRARLLEVTTPPSELTALLAEQAGCAAVETVDETALALGAVPAGAARADAAVLLESLDRALDPAGLLRAAVSRLVPGGLLFVTALVASGFDVTVLGLRNAYLYPPDRANCFSLSGLRRLIESAGCALLEVSTPGVLDVEIVQAHRQRDPSVPVSAFERQLLASSPETREAFQAFLQQQGLSSFARIVARASS